MYPMDTEHCKRESCGQAEHMTVPGFKFLKSYQNVIYLNKRGWIAVERYRNTRNIFVKRAVRQ